MRALDVHEAADLCRTRLQAVPGLKASAAIIMWKSVLWLLGDLYPGYAIVEVSPPGDGVDPGGVPVGRRPGEGETGGTNL